MTAATPILPAEVLDQLAPAIDLLRDEVRANVRKVEGKRIAHVGKVAVRANGGTGSGHDNGFRAIMEDVFNGVPDETETERQATHQQALEERDCSCTVCDDEDCDGDCETCDDYTCTQCHSTAECCGACSACDTCHEASGYGRAVYTSDSDARFCVDCRHFCSDND